MSALLYLVSGGALVYAALVGWVYANQRSMTYFPGPDMGQPVEAGAAEMLVVRLKTEDGLDLAAWYAPPGADGRVVVYFHGNAGTIAGRVAKVRPYLAAGFGVLLVEYRGYGGNPGTPSETGFYLDGAAALSFLAGEGIAPGRWVLYGESIGSGVAVELAAAKAREAGAPVGAVVLEAPFTSLVDVAAAHYPYLPVRWLAKDRFDSQAKIVDVDTSVIIVHGGRDRIVPQALGRALFAAAQEPKDGIWIEGAAHNDLHEHDLAARVLAVLGGARGR